MNKIESCKNNIEDFKIKVENWEQKLKHSSIGMEKSKSTDQKILHGNV